MELENAATEVVETETDQEVVEPDESPEEGSNYEEVAKPQSEEVEQSHEDNQRFQAMRHEIEDAQRERDEALRELEEFKAAERVKEEVYSDLIDDDDEDFNSIMADALGVSAEEVEARVAEKMEIDRLKAENEQFRLEKEEAMRREEEARANEDLTNQLAEVSKIDPSIKTVADFEEAFAGLSNTPSDYIGAGLTLQQAYWALRAERDDLQRTPPPEVGGVKSEAADVNYFSREDVMAMTSEERTKNWRLIRESQQKWK
jgi:hypothetical protein